MEPKLTDEPTKSRFELHDGDELVGWLDYRPAGESVILAHTEVPDEHGRKGYGGVLVRGALERLEQDGKTAIPLCPFAAAYIQRNLELAKYVAPSFRAQFA